MKDRSCETCKYLDRPSYDYPCCSCTSYVGKPPNSRWEPADKPKTIADYIRGITNEELADLLYDIDSREGSSDWDTWLDWLKQPYREDDNG